MAAWVVLIAGLSAFAWGAYDASSLSIHDISKDLLGATDLKMGIGFIATILGGLGLKKMSNWEMERPQQIGRDYLVKATRGNVEQTPSESADTAIRRQTYVSQACMPLGDSKMIAAQFSCEGDSYQAPQAAAFCKTEFAKYDMRQSFPAHVSNLEKAFEAKFGARCKLQFTMTHFNKNTGHLNAALKGVSASIFIERDQEDQDSLASGGQDGSINKFNQTLRLGDRIRIEGGNASISIEVI